MTERAPFPWFGGKIRPAPLVWEALGADVPNYIEPFYGSGAVLLGRPGGAGKIETANDLDGHVVNFWRCMAFRPDETAAAADWPVNELDLHARHRWLVEQIPALRERLRADPHFCDPKLAGWWVWGICCWIGGGWCAERDNRRKNTQIQPAGWHKRPQMSGDNPGRGVHRLPKQLPALAVTCDGGSTGRGVHNAVHNGAPCTAWFRRLQQRLRRVRFACGDWKRVLGPSILGKGRQVGGRKPCAVFLDPPYHDKLRARGLYSEDHDVAAKVAAWAIENGDDKDLRIALCGYENEHEMPETWREVAWVGARGYAGEDNDNRSKERIWLSPHCLEPAKQLELSL